MKRMNRMVLVLVAVFVLGGSLALLSCSSDNGDNTTNIDASGNASLLNGRTFTFADGTAFGVTPANTVTTLAFNNSSTGIPTRFSVSTATRRATGAVTFRSCDITVGPSSTNPDATGGGTNFPSGTGPQANQALSANPCTFDSDASTLTISIGATTSTSTSSGSTGTGGFGG